MFKDEIVEEIRNNRRDILESYNWDIEVLMEDSMKRQWQRGHKVFKAKKKTPQQGTAPNAYPLRGHS